jgi:hypothetical protein
LAVAKPRLKVIVSGMVAGDPHQGGATWAILQYVLGLQRLGHEVALVEPMDAVTAESAAYFEDVCAEFGLESAALLPREGKDAVGMGDAELRDYARSADLLLNVSGMLRDEALVEGIPVRVYLDLDPAFNQLWHEAEGIDVGFAGHTHFVTVGQAIGTADCLVPTCGLDWIGTLQPVVLDRWPVATERPLDAMTTVGNWRGYGSIEHDGVFYGQKAHSLRELHALPELTDERFALALAIDEGERPDLEALAAHGWELVDPVQAAGTPTAYQRFVRGSKAELGIAKSGYVVSRCGWFSDRSACYLASGRPVLAQDTSFGSFLPIGEGLFAFRTVDDVLTAIAELRRDYEKHSRAARTVAEQHFDSDRVLGGLLARVVG